MFDLCFTIDRVVAGVIRCDHVIFAIGSRALRFFQGFERRKRASDDVHRVDDIQDCAQRGTAAMVTLFDRFSVGSKLECLDVHERIKKALAADHELVQTN